MAKRISIFARWRSSSAGSLPATAASYAAGQAFHEFRSSLLQGVVGANGRERAERGVAWWIVCAIVGFVWRSGARSGADWAAVASSAARTSATARAMTGSSARSRRAQDVAHQLVAEGVVLLDHPRAGFGHVDEHDPPVLRDTDAFDEPALLHPVDQARSRWTATRPAAPRDGSSASRRALQRVHDVEMGHADAQPHEASLIAQLQRADRHADVGDDAVSRLIARGRLGVRGLLRPRQSFVSRECMVRQRIILSTGLIRPTCRSRPMRFALMIEPQQGSHYDDQLADRPPRRGGRLRDPVPVRPLRELSGRFGSTHHRRLDRRRRSGARDGADRARGAGVAGDLPDPRQPGQGRGHGRRDERRAHRARRRRRLERGGARRHGFPFPAIGERAEMLEETLEILRGLWDEPDGWSFTGRHYAWRTRCSGRSRRPPGPERPRAADHRRRRGDTALVPDRGPLRRRVQPLIGEPRGRGPEVRAARRDRVQAAGRDPSTLVHSAMVGLLIGRDARRGRRRREADLLTSFGEADDGAEAWFATAPAALDLGTPDEAREGARAVRRRRGRAAHAPGLPAPGPRDDRPRRGVAVRLIARSRPTVAGRVSRRPPRAGWSRTRRAHRAR